MELFSFSRLKLFATCPRRFAFKYVEKMPDPPGQAAILGKTVHKAIDLCLNGRWFEDAIATAYMIEGYGTVEKTIVDTMTKAALSYGYEGTTEQHFVMELADKVKLQGYIDLRNDNGIVPTLVDWKTGFKFYRVLDTWQLPLYASAVMEQIKIKEVKCVLAFLRFNKTPYALIGQKEASRAKAWAIQTAQEIQRRLELLTVLEPREAFPAKPSPECGNCPWSLFCLRESKESINF